jgi:hypothetical protein
MTKERVLNTAEAMKFTSQGYLRWLHTAHSGIDYESTVFEIKPTAPLNDFTRCNTCEKKGKFLIHDKDHLNDHAVNIVCADHSPELFFKFLESKDSA